MKTLGFCIIMGLATQVFAQTPKVLPAPVPFPTDAWAVVLKCVEGTGKVRDYTCTIVKQELIRNVLRPEQVLDGRFRAIPQAIFVRWTAGPHKGREVLYVAGRDGGKALVKLGDWPILKPVVKVQPDSAEAMGDARYPVTLAGIHPMARRMHDQFVKAREDGTLTSRVVGPEALDGRITLCIQRTLEDGGIRTWNIDPVLWVPVRICTRDRKGGIVESYWFRDLKVNVNLLDRQFDPEVIW
jgi:hypothetical protein